MKTCPGCGAPAKDKCDYCGRGSRKEPKKQQKKKRSENTGPR